MVIEGIKSIFNEAFQLCIDNNEVSKYLMTFQNLLYRVPKWNAIIVEEECKRIIEKSGCNYLEDLITCVHVIQLKVLTSIRVGNKQKKIDINIPKLDNFVHKIYISVARKIYTNVYLFEKNISPLEIQKNNRELEKIVQECILNCIRESIPTSEIIRAYLDSSVETEEEVIIENIPDTVVPQQNGVTTATTDTTETPKNNDDSSSVATIVEEKPPEIVPTVKNIDNEPVITRLTFNDLDSILDENDNIQNVTVSKSVEELEKNNMEKHLRRQLENSEDDDDDDDVGRIKIMENIVLDDINSLDEDTANRAANSISLNDPLLDFEEL